jgi:hypothetical protein
MQGPSRRRKNRLWKSCGRPVHFLLSKRQRKIIFEADQPAKTPRGVPVDEPSSIASLDRQRLPRKIRVSSPPYCAAAEW